MGAPWTQIRLNLLIFKYFICIGYDDEAEVHGKICYLINTAFYLLTVRLPQTTRGFDRKTMNIYRLLHITPMPESRRLRLRRYFMDREVSQELHRFTKNGGDSTEFWDYNNWQFEYQQLDEDEASFHSRQLLGRARELRIPTPQVFVGSALSPDYQRSGLDGHRYYLSLTGEQKVRSAIREEEKYRAERWARRIPYMTALSGLIGTITGLVALLANWGS